MSEDLQTTLVDVAGQFDLSEYEIRAYLAILDGGTVTAADIARAADMPQPRVYDTVRSLSDSGLIELKETRPMKALALPPDEAVGGLTSTLDDLVDQLSARYSAPVRTESGASLVTSRSTIRRYLGEVVDAAEYELLVSLSPMLLDSLGDDLAAARDRGVTIDLLVSPAASVPDLTDEDALWVAATVRTRRGITTPIVAVADGRYAIYATREALHGANGDDSSRYGVIFNRAELGFLASSFFNTVLWATSETLSESDTARSFPRRYATIRRCVAELQDVPDPLYATVTGRDIETGQRLVCKGELVSVAVGTTSETATLVVETDEGLVDVGGELASLEDVEAREIVVDRDAPPEVGA